MSRRIFALIPFLLICLAFCHGCGGGSSGGSPAASTRGSIEFTILWPEQGRVLPAAAKSLLFTVSSGSQVIASVLAPRPSTTNTSAVVFNSLQPGIVTVTVNAYPNADGTGVIQAVGGITVAVIAGQTTRANVDLVSTVDHLDLNPSPVVTLRNRTVQLVVSPRNAANALVLVAPSSLTWTSAAANIATVDTNGLVTGVALGDTTVRVVDTESGHIAEATVHVVPPVVVNPPQVTIPLGDIVQFTASVTQLASTNVTWSIEEQGNAGSIDSTGKYTAPQVPGTFHVVATSVSDPSLSGRATVIVQAGSGTVIIQ